MMSNSNSFSFFGIPDDYNFPQINLHHKKVSDSGIGHMLQNFPPEEETLDPSNIINISNFVALQNLQNTANLTRSCGDLRGQLIYGDDNNIHLQEAKVAVGDLGIITRSVESLDCLLSATYTNTDTSIEDDGISSLFCDGKSLWTFGSSSQTNAITSGESAGNGPQTSSNLHDHNQAKIQPCFSQSEVRTLEPSRSCKMVEEESIMSQNLNSSISRIQDNMHDHNISNNLKSVRSCIKVRKESGTTTSPIPENATKKRNIGETFLESGPPSYHFLDTDIYSEKSDHHDFHLFSENPEKPKKHTSEKCPIINFQQPNNASTSSGGGGGEQDSEAIAQMKEIIYGAAAFRPVNLGVDVVEKPKRRNVKISDDPQTVAARQRRERISERIRVLQTLVPGGTKMDTASMLDEAANYLKFLRSRVKELEVLGQWRAGGFENYYSAATFACPSSSVLPFLHPMSAQSYFCLQNPNSFNHHI